LPGGRLARLLVSFQNNGSTAFLVENLEGSFRFPQDFSYVIQNFTAFEFNKVVESERESTFEYMFTPSEAFSQRQLGLTINLRYRGQDGKSFINTVFNETVTIVDFEEGFDGETFFLYLFLAGIVVLLVLGANQLFSSKKNKISRLVGGSGSSSAQRQQQQANGSTGDVDLDWIPSTHLSTSK
jgi:translocon-associated protein subunit alpha